MSPRSFGTDRDPLEQGWSRRVVVIATVAVAVGAFVASALGTRPERLPGVALESFLLLHMERALVVAGSVASLLIFVTRGWDGYFPSKLSASGAEYAERSAVAEGVGNEEEMVAALADMDGKRLALAKSLHADIDELKRRMAREGSNEAGRR